MSRLLDYFRKAVAEAELSHAYLLEIPEKEKAEELGRKIAGLILCREKSGCGSCEECRAVESRNHPDVITVRHEKPTVLAVNEIRAQLVEDIGIRPYRSPYKIYLVPDAELMNPQAQNALLKTLEEPPAYGVILLLTANRSAFLPTVLSRCVSLTENGTEAEEESGTEAKTLLFTYLHRAESLTAAETAGIMKRLSESGMSKAGVYLLLEEWLRDLMAARGGAEGFYFPEEQRYYREWNDKLPERSLGSLWEDLRLAEARTNANVNADVALEIFFLHLREALRAK